MFRAFPIVVVLTALSSAVPALAQSDEDVTIAASCDSGGSYGIRGGPVQGWILGFGGEYSIDLYVVPSSVRAAVGSLRPNDAATGWLHVDVNAPSLDLSHPDVRIDTLSIQGPPVLAPDHNTANWRVRLTVGGEADWYGPGGVFRSTFTHTSYTVDQPFGAEPYIGFYDRDDEPAATEVYRRLIAGGAFTAEFHVPRRGFTSGYLFAVSEFSLQPLEPVLAQARAHFAACDAAAGV